MRKRKKGEKRKETTHIVTKVGCTLLTTNSSLPPEHQAKLDKHYAHDIF